MTVVDEKFFRARVTKRAEFAPDLWMMLSLIHICEAGAGCRPGRIPASPALEAVAPAGLVDIRP